MPPVRDQRFEPNVLRNNSFFADVFMLLAATMLYQLLAGSGCKATNNQRIVKPLECKDN